MVEYRSFFKGWFCWVFMFGNLFGCKNYMRCKKWDPYSVDCGKNPKRCGEYQKWERAKRISKIRRRPELTEFFQEHPSEALGFY